ncbi:Cyclin-dependent kinase 2 [Tilletia horrida]|nr:Cyclin-dependent kinase 2 [Tilletia horrida]
MRQRDQPSSVDTRGAGPYGPVGELWIFDAFTRRAKTMGLKDLTISTMSQVIIPQLAALLLHHDAGVDMNEAQQYITDGGAYGRLVFPMTPSSFQQFSAHIQQSCEDQHAQERYKANVRSSEQISQLQSALTTSLQHGHDVEAKLAESEQKRRELQEQVTTAECDADDSAAELASVKKQHREKEAAWKEKRQLLRNKCTALEDECAKLKKELEGHVAAKKQSPTPFRLVPPSQQKATPMRLVPPSQQKSSAKRPTSSHDTGPASKRTPIPADILDRTGPPLSLSAPRLPPYTSKSGSNRPRISPQQPDDERERAHRASRPGQASAGPELATANVQEIPAPSSPKPDQHQAAPPTAGPDSTQVIPAAAGLQHDVHPPREVPRDVSLGTSAQLTVAKEMQLPQPPIPIHIQPAPMAPKGLPHCKPLSRYVPPRPPSIPGETGIDPAVFGWNSPLVPDHQRLSFARGPGRYHNFEYIGMGAHGSVYRANDLLGAESVAIKVSSVGASGCFRSSLWREIGALRLLRHPNIVALRDVVLTSDGTTPLAHLVLEYAQTDLLQVLTTHGGSLGAPVIKKWAFQILSGLSAVHKAYIVHFDLKPANILIAADGTARLADFGLAEDIRLLLDFPRTRPVGSLWYRAPEALLREQNLGPDFDVWSWAVTYAEMIGARKSPLFLATSPMNAMEGIAGNLLSAQDNSGDKELWPGADRLPGVLPNDDFAYDDTARGRTRFRGDIGRERFFARVQAAVKLGAAPEVVARMLASMARTKAQAHHKREGLHPCKRKSPPAKKTVLPSTNKARPGDAALREIKRYQRSTEHLIDKAPFRRLIREITQDYTPRGARPWHERMWYEGYMYTETAMEALQDATEDYIVELLMDW